MNSIVIPKEQVPVGSIVAWAKNITGCPSLPAGWAECNGGAITSGPMNGQSLPDLNSAGQKRFLRGSTTSGTAGGSVGHIHSMSMLSMFLEVGSGQPLSYPLLTGVGGVSYASHLPSYYEVVFVMKVY